VHCAASGANGANGEAGPEGERWRRESRERGPKKARPASRPALCAGSAGFARSFDGTSVSCRETRVIHAARPSGLMRESRRSEGGRQIEIKTDSSVALNSNSEFMIARIVLSGVPCGK